MLEIGKPQNVLNVTGIVGKFLASSFFASKKLSDDIQKRRYYVNNTSQASSKIIDQLNFDVKITKSREDLFKDQTYFVVSNHMSYLDILVMARVIPSVFVTSNEIKETFLLGDICEAGGSLFIERRNKKRLAEDVKMIGSVMNEGFNLVVYPEGTTGDGNTVLPFKRGLFATAINIGKPVLPACIKYKKINGVELNDSNRDLICWYGEMTFLPHFLGLRRLESVEVEIDFLDPIDPKEVNDRGQLCERSRNQILECYHANGFGDPNAEIKPEIMARVPSSFQQAAANRVK